jgi:hypothetical protein
MAPISQVIQIHVKIFTVAICMYTFCSFQARDVDKTSHITYSIIEGNVNNLFSINPQSGEITVSNPYGLDMTNVSNDVIVLTVQVCSYCACLFYQ